jgi:competence CoiA-like predicted nuclease
MLKALLDNEEIISIDPQWEDKKEELRQLCNNRAVCPICGETVICKFGDYKVHHFAHNSKSNCPNKRDSLEHIKGLALLYSYFKSQLGEKDEIVIEHYFKASDFIADILIKLHSKEIIAVEFYAKHRTNAEIKKKIEFYKNNRTKVIWILSENLIKKVEKNYIKLSNLELNFLKMHPIEKLYLKDDWYEKIIVDKEITDIHNEINYSCMYYLNIETGILSTYKALIETRHLRVFYPSKIISKKLNEYYFGEKKIWLYTKEDIDIKRKYKEAKKALKELKLEEKKKKEFELIEAQKFFKNKSSLKKDILSINERYIRDKEAKIYTCEICGKKLKEEDMIIYIAGTKIGKCKKCL